MQGSYVETLSIQKGTEHHMGGEKKKAGSAGGNQKKKKVDTTPIQEYDFFVMRNGGEADESDSADHPVKKRSRKKSTSFFLSD